MAKHKISVCMCTFNGETYVREQLDSLSAQTRLPDELIVCDDSSTDATPRILEEFKREAAFPVHVHVNSQTLGPRENFEQAIRLCTGDAIFPADQDDVWMENKIERLSFLLRDMEARFGEATPMIVHSDLVVVDQNLERIAQSFLQFQGIVQDSYAPLSALLLSNFVTGCACAINRALADLALPIPKQAIMHDWWLALCAAAAGRLQFVEEPTVEYRQHASNAIGAKRHEKKRSLSPDERKARIDLIRKTVDQAEALSDRLHERGQGDSKSLSMGSCYSRILTTPRLLRPFHLAYHNIRPAHCIVAGWRRLTRRLRFYYILALQI